MRLYRIQIKQETYKAVIGALAITTTVMDRIDISVSTRYTRSYGMLNQSNQMDTLKTQSRK